jgi:two-component system, NtrC family, nitrogen regulation response regulator NtrX
MDYHILIIEDETETSRHLKLALEDENPNFKVQCAENGRIGLEKLGKQEFDLVVLDLKMPHMLGDEVLHEIRKIAPYVIVVVWTNYGNNSDMDTMNLFKNLMKEGVDGFIPKGAEADLYKTVEVIKTKLFPSEETSKKLFGDFFKQLPRI